ncbi:flagellin [Desulfosporosinus sp. PR]|uniref:flagellin N-terminal helical domain-containing protein n=1 Tax=Candidatus Desulfosporosinus nitrosoreducens TaxID=3401928 RepID=UPI002800609B|nr:flagellin [Desulfosporosinus sp. PR]MDQ7096258.1 flagellin [Desulfosporosinus sp. PR]
MIINTNIAALNTIRQLGINEKATQSSLSKLSSGFRINSAADDAAGLSISEKMRGQISGLNQASSNAQSGINLAATAEGALNTTTSILQRMRELAVQASNGTNTTSDNQAMSDEFNQLKSALDDIGNQTQFNTKNLLDGSLAGAAGVSVGQNATTGAVAGKLSAAVMGASAAMTTLSAIAATHFTAETINIDGTDITVNWQNLTTEQQNTINSGLTGSNATSRAAAVSLIIGQINSAIDASGSKVSHVTGYVNSAGSLMITSGSSGTSSEILVETKTGGSVLNTILGTAGTLAAMGKDTYNGTSVSSGKVFSMNINGQVLKVTVGTGGYNTNSNMSSIAASLQQDLNDAIDTANSSAGATQLGDPGFIANVKVNVTDDGRLQVISESGPVTFSDTAGNTFTSDLGLSNAQTSAQSSGGMTFQIGANAGQTMTFGINDMRTAALGLSGVSIDSQSSAENAITAITNATAKVSAERSKLGAIQNRLQDTIDNLGTSSQNITTAEANIRDVDMASEMTNFQKNNVLQQAAQAMLAQANQQPQAVLQLLR